jgi:hypothetical protein
MTNLLPTIAVSILLTGLLFLLRYCYLDYQAKKEKSFIVVGLGLLLFWAFGGIGLTTLGILLLLVVLFKGC